MIIILLSAISRFVEPIERTGYKQWASQASRMNQTEDEQQEQNSVSDCLPGGCDQQNSESCAEEETTTTTTQLSFAEVMRLVQEGKEVPGVKQLDVKASNQSPTPSRMERVLKPWETSWGSKDRTVSSEIYIFSILKEDWNISCFVSWGDAIPREEMWH